jgi:prephenate dehydratase
MELAHTPGSLYAALGAFAASSINISLLVSRPLIGKPGQYRFYIDCEAGLADKALQEALRMLKEQRVSVTLLGSYRQATTKS